MTGEIQVVFGAAGELIKGILGQVTWQGDLSPGSGRQVRVSFRIGAPPSSTDRQETVTDEAVDPME